MSSCRIVLSLLPSAPATFDAIERELGVSMVPRILLLLEGRPDVLPHKRGP